MRRFQGNPRGLFYAALVCGVTCAGLMGAGRGSLTQLTLDPDAPVVELFAGVEDGQLGVRVVAENPHEGRIFITNTTDRLLTVAVPKGLVGVQVLPQFNGQGAGFGFQNGQGLVGQNGQNGQFGPAQAVGGNAFPVGNNAFPNANGNNLLPGGNAQGFFSIPPEKTVQLALRSVCLNYGRPEPNVRMKYHLMPASAFTTDPVLQQLLEESSPRIARDVQQAAAWHLASSLSWERLAALKTEPIPGQPRAIFTRSQLQAAQDLVKSTQENAARRARPAEGTVARSSR